MRNADSNATISTYIRELCNELRANVFAYGSFKFVLSRYMDVPENLPQS
jgi:hypothetical protein